MSSLSVGIIGCGWMGEEHAKRYASISDTTVSAATDFDENTREHFGETHGIPNLYATHEEMLENEELDILSVCTWQGTHAQLTIEACEAGIEGVLCEKPMATSMGEARDMVDAADRNDVDLVIGHQRRYSPVSERVRELVADEAIGAPHVVYTKATSGLLNWGTHLIDLTRYFLGDVDPVWVAGHLERNTDRYERGEPIEDTCSGLVAYEDGTRLTIEIDTPEPHRGDVSYEIYGANGALELDLGRRATVTNERGRTEYEPEESIDEQLALVREFVELVEGDRTDHRCEASEAIPTMEIMMGLYESVRCNELVELPVQTRANPLERLIDERLHPTRPGRYDIRRPYESIR